MHLVSIIDSANKSYHVVKLRGAASLENVTITNIVTSTTQDKSLILNFEAGIALTNIISGLLVFYTNDNELLLGSDDMITNDNWVCYPTSGIVANIQLLYIIL
jgi:hypothetical protein